MTGSLALIASRSASQFGDIGFRRHGELAIDCKLEIQSCVATTRRVPCQGTTRQEADSRAPSPPGPSSAARTSRSVDPPARPGPFDAGEIDARSRASRRAAGSDLDGRFGREKLECAGRPGSRPGPRRVRCPRLRPRRRRVTTMVASTVRTGTSSPSATRMPGKGTRGRRHHFEDLLRFGFYQRFAFRASPTRSAT